jgi:hypothetical protein
LHNDFISYCTLGRRVGSTDGGQEADRVSVTVTAPAFAAGRDRLAVSGLLVSRRRLSRLPELELEAWLSHFPEPHWRGTCSAGWLPRTGWERGQPDRVNS